MYIISRCHRNFLDACGTCYLVTLRPTICLQTTERVATDLCLSWPEVLNLVTVRGSMKTPV